MYNHWKTVRGRKILNNTLLTIFRTIIIIYNNRCTYLNIIIRARVSRPDVLQIVPLRTSMEQSSQI